MSDEPLGLEPVRSASPLAGHLLVGALAFVVGAVLAVMLVHLLGYGPWQRPAPLNTVPAPQQEARPAPAQLPPGTDIATLAAREQALAARLEALDTRLREVDTGARAASGYATQAERLLIAAAARRSIERGLELGPIEPQLRQRFGETHPDAVGTLVQAAGQPVTLEDLRIALQTIGPRLTVAPGEGWWSGAQRLFSDLVVLRSADSPSPRPGDRLKRAERMLDEGQVEGALAEVMRLPGASAGESWVTAAKRYIGARAALREIEVGAMEPRAGS
jgi:hypothetical protein